MKISLDLRYIAGVIDSDGSICISKYDNHGYVSYRPMVQLTWKNIKECRDVIESLKEVYGGCVFIEKSKRKLGGNNTYLAYKVDTRKAEKLLDDIKSSLWIKKEQAVYAIRVQQIKEEYNWTRNPILIKEKNKKLDYLWKEVKKMNAKVIDGGDM